MKAIRFVQIIALLSILFFFSMCEKEKVWDTLPPETQEGKNTFGCYVNGELFVKEKEKVGFFTPPNLSASYYQSTQFLSISCIGRDEMGSIDFWVLNPVVGIRQTPLLAELSKSVVLKETTGTDNIIVQEIDIVRYKLVENTGEIILTKLDTINRIVSGRFQFQGKYSGRSLNIVGDSIVSVTDGRFDIKLYIDN